MNWVSAKLIAYFNWLNTCSFLGETAANMEPLALQHNHIGKVHKGTVVHMNICLGPF